MASWYVQGNITVISLAGSIVKCKEHNKLNTLTVKTDGLSRQINCFSNKFYCFCVGALFSPHPPPTYSPPPPSPPGDS